MRVGIFSGNAVQDEGVLLAKVRQAPEMTGADLAAEVATKETYVVPAVGTKKFTVAAIDLGIKGMTPHRMAERGIEVHVLPATATLEDVYAVEPDGVFFSNGPGDPSTADHPVSVMRGVLERKTPLFGICFGNQILGRSLGFGTYKLKYGHRGINQPVQDRTTGKVEVTAHNHGFAVDAPLDRVSDTEFGRAEVSHVCLNDQVVEGLQAARPAGLQRPVPPRSSRGPARRRVPLRPFRHPDGGPACLSAPISSPSWSSAPVRSSSGRQPSSTTPAPRPAACSRPRACASSW